MKLPDELVFLQNGKKEQKSSFSSMIGKICVITGATSGVGLAALQRLAEGGANIVMVCRNLAKAEKIKTEITALNQVRIEIVIADFSSLAEVRAAAEIIKKAHPVIDVLINSAGIHSTKRTYNKEGLEMVFCVNHLATFLFTELLFEQIKASEQGRIIQVNSEGHRFNGLRIDDLNWQKRIYTGLRSYGAAKTAQLLTVWEFAERLQESRATINAMHPGDVKTGIGSNNGWLYKLFLHKVIWLFLKDVKISGEALYYLASDPEMAEVNGCFFNLTTIEKPAPHATNRKLGKLVWDISRKMTGVI